MTAKEMQRRSAKARWNGKTAEARRREMSALVAVAEAATSVSDAVAEGCSSEGEFIIGLNAKLIEALASLTAVREGGAK